MSDKDDNLPSLNERSVALPDEILKIVERVSRGEVKNAKMEWDGNGSIDFTADSLNGQSRISITNRVLPGVIQESKSHITKPIDKEERLERVLQLKKDGKTQKDISLFTMTSQKTVSNDIKELKSLGKLK